jgi:hypothetical protein
LGPKALKALKRAGIGKPPIKGDELPPRKRRAYLPVWSGEVPLHF